MDFMTTFSQRLKEIRHLRKISQNDLSEIVSTQTISSYETFDGVKMKKIPSLQNAVAIAEMLEVPLDYLCGFLDAPYYFSIRTAADAIECIDEMVEMLDIEPDISAKELKITIKDKNVVNFYNERRTMLDRLNKKEIREGAYDQWRRTADKSLKMQKIKKPDIDNGGGGQWRAYGRIRRAAMR